MRKHVFVIVRYSVLTNDGSQWILGRNHEFEAYKERLFGAQRMAQHEYLFENLTLPSLKAMNPSQEDFTLIVLTSTELPVANRKNLERMLKPFGWARIISMPPILSGGDIVSSAFRQELFKFDDKLCYCTVRLDDDDALAPSFLRQLEKYLEPHFSEFCVSFPRGYVGVYDSEERTYESFHHWYKPKIGLGLSLVNVFDPEYPPQGSRRATIYHVGNHTKVDHAAPLVLDARQPMYIRTYHSQGDTNNEQQIKKARSAKSIDHRSVEEWFQIP